MPPLPQFIRVCDTPFERNIRILRFSREFTNCGIFATFPVFHRIGCRVKTTTLLESGLEGLWTPILINKLGYCEHHCTLCGQACPTGAIREISVQEKVGEPPFERPIKLGTAFYDHGRCLPWAMHTECIVCEEMGPTSPKAIWYKKVRITGRDGEMTELKQPYVEPQLCIGCGICENKCPVEDMAAIRVSSVGETRSVENQMILKQ